MRYQIGGARETTLWGLNNIQAQSNVRFMEGYWRLLNCRSSFVEGWDFVRGRGSLVVETSLLALMGDKSHILSAGT